MKIIAHRGVHTDLPENSQQSFDAAIQAGAEMMEFDVQLTRDKIAVVCHDDSLLRTHGVNANISELTYRQLISQTPHQPIMTLSAILRRYGGRIKLNIELKAPGTGRAVGRIVAGRAGRLPLKTLLVSSFQRRELRDFQHSCSTVAISILFRKHPSASLLYSFHPGIEVVSFSHDKLPPRWILQFLKLRGLGVYCYTVNDPLEAIKLEKSGIDGIFCDDAPTMRRVMTARPGM